MASAGSTRSPRAGTIHTAGVGTPPETNGGRPRRIVVVAFDSAELCLRLASALSAHAAVRLILPAQDSRPHLKWLSPSVDFRPFDKPRLRQPLRQASVLRRVHGLVRGFEPDVVHFQKGHAWFNLTLPLLRRRFPLVVSIHDPVHHLGDRSSRRNPQWLMHFGYRRADRVIAHNAAMRREIVERCGIPAERIDVVPLIERGDDSARPEVEEDGSILFFGRIWPYKGLEYLIRAEPAISAAVPEARIVVAGRGEDFERYRKLMARPERFRIHNEFVSVEERAALFRRAAVVVLPYVEATQSGVIPVAYTYGKPVVATNVGGLAEQIENGRTGFLVPPRDSSALAARVVELLRDPELRRAMGRNAKEKLVREWSAEVVARRTLEVYERAIASRSWAR
jgi:glycosyltransferase involved in cell wall biosynthesis